MIEYEFSSSSSTSELNAVAETPPPEEPKIKYKVPYIEELSKENIVKVLTPYKGLIDQIQAVLLWRWPVQSTILLIYFNLWSLITYLLDLSFINVLIIILVTVVYLAILHRKKGVVSSFFFPPIPVNKDEEQSNRIYSLEEISELLSTVGSRFYCFAQSCLQKATDMSFFGQLSWIAILLCMFVFFKIARTFWICVITVNFFLTVPGIIFRPNIYPRFKYNLQWLMMVISPKIKDD